LAGDSEIINKYKSETVKSVIDNGLKKILGGDLSKQFIDNVLNSQIENTSYRTDYIYSVKYCNQNTTTYEINQDIAYRKHIKTKKDNLEISVFFTNEKDPFALSPTENIVFFREELSNSFFKTIIGKNDTDIISSLNFEIELCNNNTNKMDVINITQVTKSCNNDAIVFSITVPKDYLKEEQDGFKSFYAQIRCKYPSDNENNYFYSVFPEPTKDAIFNICFDDAIVKKENIHYLSFISTSNYEIKKDTIHNGLNFALKKNLPKDKEKYNTIFPHSGIVLHW
jgi:hypothetical protein